MTNALEGHPATKSRLRSYESHLLGVLVESLRLLGLEGIHVHKVLRQVDRYSLFVETKVLILVEEKMYCSIERW